MRRDAQDQQRRVIAHEAALDRTHRGGGGTHDPARAPDERLVHDARLEHVAREAPGGEGGAHDDRVDQLVEVPLVHEQLIEGAEARAHAFGRPRLLHPHAVGDRDSREPEDRPEDQPEHEQAVLGVDRVEGRAVERRFEELRDHVVDFGDLDQPGADRADSEQRHRDLHRDRALSDRVVGAREADVGVLDFAGRGVGRVRRVVQVAFFELARLGHGVPVERAEDHPERVDRGHEGADVAEHVERPVPAAELAGHEQDLVLGEESGERWDAGQRQAADHEAAERERQRLAEAAHLLQRLLAGHRADDRARAHEQQRLEEGVRHQVEHARGVRADGDAHDHVADLRHRRVGDHALDVGLGEGDRGRDEQGRAADRGADLLGGRREFEQRVHAGDQVDAGGHHRRRVDQRADRGGSFHRVGQPGLERNLRGLRERAHQQQKAACRQVAVAVGAERAVRGRAEGPEHFQRAGVLEDEEGAEHEADIADDVDHERLQPGFRCGPAPVPERDQQVGGGADECPADDQQQEVPGQDQEQHREDEEVEVREEPVEALVFFHVGDRVEVDQRRDAGDDQDHPDRQGVDEDRHLRVDADGRGVVVERGDELAVVGVVPLQRDQRADCRDERECDRRGADPARRVALQAPEAERADERARQRERQHEPAPCGRAHPCSSRSSSTSIGSRRR